MNNIHSLYIHIPFCEHICDYCDFPKLQYFRMFAEKYIDSLINEIESYNINPDGLNTIYIGGGTPTSLDDDLFEKLLTYLDKYSRNIKEFTVECNPESLSDNKLRIMKVHHVNRLSLGVESTDDEILRLINRHHTYQDVKTAILRARSHGFDNLNVDLILGLPHASKAQLDKDLDNILSLNVEHISCYSLTVHPNTMFGIKGINEPLEDTSRELYDVVENKLKENGFIHYEVSNWCKENRHSLHNLTYWKDEQYYGCGLGASGYIGNIRYTNTLSINEYNEGRYGPRKEVVNQEDDRTYFIMLNLRTVFGLDLANYKNRFGEDLYLKHKKNIDDFIDRKLLILSDKKLIPTYEGMMILDTILLELIK